MAKFFHLPKNRKYDYRPVYFDPLEDELKERVKLIEAELDAEEGLLDEATKARYERERAKRLARKFELAREQKMRTKKGGRSAIKIFALLAALIAAIYKFYLS